MVKFMLAIVIALLSAILLCFFLILFRPQTPPKFLPPPNVREAAEPRKQWNITYTNQNLWCLSEAIFHEAGTESSRGKEAVGIVILNRAEQKATQNLCSIVHESTLVDGKRICQFSYYCLIPQKRINPTSGVNWAECVFISAKLMNNEVSMENESLTAGAIYFHADYVHPAWAKNKKLIVKIGSHLFYGDK